MKTKDRIASLELEIELLKQKKQLLEDIKNLETVDNFHWPVYPTYPIGPVYREPPIITTTDRTVEVSPYTVTTALLDNKPRRTSIGLV